MRRELAAAAMELFATKGYEATTVDEIAAAAGVARRTFFRHFRSKEEAIFPDHDDTLIRAEAVLNAAPAARAPARHGVPGHQGGHEDVRGLPGGLGRALPADPRGAHPAGARRSPRWPATSGCSPAICWATSTSAHHHDGNDDPLLAEVAASAVVTAHNHVLRRWLRAGGQGDVEAQLDHAFAIVRETFGTGIGAGRATARRRRAAPAATAVRTQGEVLVAVARTDAPLDEVMRTIERGAQGPLELTRVRDPGPSPELHRSHRCDRRPPRPGRAALRMSGAAFVATSARPLRSIIAHLCTSKIASERNFWHSVSCEVTRGAIR